MQPNFILSSIREDISIVMEDINDLTLSDLCRACGTHADIIIELIGEGVIDISDMDRSPPQEHWRFTGVQLHRAKVAVRLHRDLGVNFAGAALVLQLLEELDVTKAKLQSIAM